jgi:hypothetical protein
VGHVGRVVKTICFGEDLNGYSLFTD